MGHPAPRPQNDRGGHDRESLRALKADQEVPK